MRRRAQESEYNNFKTSVEKLNGADIYDLLLTIEYGGQKHEYFFDFHIASTQIREIVKNGAKLEPL